MKATITQDDIDKAIEANKTESICQSCVLFQVMKRVGIPVREVTFVGFSMAGIDGWHLFPKKGKAEDITMLNPCEWQSTLGMEIELPELAELMSSRN